MSCLHSERERERKREFQTEGTFIYASALPQGGVQQLWKNGRKETVHLYMLRKKNWDWGGKYTQQNYRTHSRTRTTAQLISRQDRESSAHWCMVRQKWGVPTSMMFERCAGWHLIRSLICPNSYCFGRERDRHTDRQTDRDRQNVRQRQTDRDR